MPFGRRPKVDAAALQQQVQAAVAASTVQQVQDAVAASGVGTPPKLLAAQLDVLIVGAVTRNADGAATAAPLEWPDGGTGAYTAIALSTDHPGAVDSYQVTHIRNGATRTYTQPAVTRNADGAVTFRPALTES